VLVVARSWEQKIVKEKHFQLLVRTMSKKVFTVEINSYIVCVVIIVPLMQSNNSKLSLHFV